MSRHSRDTVDTWWTEAAEAVPTAAPPGPVPVGPPPQFPPGRQAPGRHALPDQRYPPARPAFQQRQPPRPPRPRPAPDPRGSGRRHLLVAFLWALLAVSLYLWWRDTDARSLTDRGALLVAAGRITGLVAGYLLLAQVFLMSRVGFLEGWVGAELLVRWHRDFGGVLVVAVVVHTVTIVWGYGILDGLSPLDELGVLLAQYEDMVSALVAGAVMVALGLLGIRAVRNAMPYELWKFLHLASYAVLLLGFGHQFANGQQLFQPGFGRWFWIGLYAAVLACLVWGRFVAPVVLNLRHRFEVADVVEEGPDIVSIYLSARRLDRLEVRAGQFFRWRFLARGLRWQAHPFSLSAAANGRWLRLTVKVVGSYTAALRELTPGVRVWAQGPSGSFTALRRTRSRALLIAGGSGIAPIRALLEELPPGAKVIYRASTPGEVVLREELDRLAEIRRAEVWYVVGSRRDPGPRSLLTSKGMRQLVPDVARRDVYLCGPGGLVKASTRALRGAGVPRRQIHATNFEF